MFQLALPAVHAAARRPDRVRRDGVAGARRCSPIRWPAPTSCSTRRSTPRSAATARGASPRRRRRWTSGTSRSRWRSTRRASPTRATSRSSSSAASRRRAIKPLVETYIASLPATRAQRDVARSRHRAADRRRREDDREGHRAEEPGGDRLLRARSTTTTQHLLALRTMTLLLQSRLFDTIRQELGGTYSITATPETRKVPRPEYSRADRLDLRPGADRRRSCSGCSRRSSSCRRTPSQPGAGGAHPRCAAARVRARTARTTAICSTRSRAATRTATRPTSPSIVNLPDRIAALTGDAIQQAAQTYLEHGELREGDADAGREVSARVRGPAGRRGTSGQVQLSRPADPRTADPRTADQCDITYIITLMPTA